MEYTVDYLDDDEAEEEKDPYHTSDDEKDKTYLPDEEIDEDDFQLAQPDKKNKVKSTKGLAAGNPKNKKRECK